MNAKKNNSAPSGMPETLEAYKQQVRQCLLGSSLDSTETRSVNSLMQESDGFFREYWQLGLEPQALVSGWAMGLA